MLNPAALLDAYDTQLRGRMPKKPPPGIRRERDGPLVRGTGDPQGGFIVYRDLGGAEGAELDELIARQVAYFAARRERFEWKLHGHDCPRDLPDRLLAAGFVAEEAETVVIAPVAVVAREPVVPAGVSLRDVYERRDFERIAALEYEVWQEQYIGLATTLEAEREADPDALAVVVADVQGEVVCAGWIRFVANTEFATLWGGSTLPAWRGRGIYRAIVAYRANLAATHGCRYLEVDASADSRPILERLGFVAVTTTTPYIWSPPAP